MGKQIFSSLDDKFSIILNTYIVENGIWGILKNN